MTGTTLSHYRVLEKLGEGGMGEVYKAHDTQLKRDVALKVLPAEVATDPDRLARFQREAELLAALNHPHIAQIHGLAEAEGVRALVMELVEGPTLEERIAKGSGIGGQGSGSKWPGIPIDEALPIATQLAEALEYAHERGIIHRDLKPANIKLTADGAVKVLDFGLAKALAADAAGATADPLGNSPTFASPAETRAGLILGTAAYMAPEQARGAAVDKRADIWAFGVVLFEMLTGRPCFAGETVTDVLAAVVKTEPDWTMLPAETPAPTRQLLLRCVTKDRKQRLHDIGDARLELEEAASDRSGPPRPRGRVAKWLHPLPWFVAVAMAIMAAVLAAWIAMVPPLPPTVMRFRISLPEDLDRWRDLRRVAISPDGSQIAYIGGGLTSTRIYHRRLADLDFRALAGTEGARELFFSPDGRSVGFFADGKLKLLTLATGQIDKSGGYLDVNAGGGNWGPGQDIFFHLDFRRGIARVEVSRLGMLPESVLEPQARNNERGLLTPQRLPVGDLVLMTAFAGDVSTMDDARIVVGRLGDKTSRWELVRGGASGRYLPSGHLVYARGGRLLAAPVNLANRNIGDSVPVLDDVATFSATGGAQFSVADTGHLIYAAGGALQLRDSMVMIDRSGREQPVYLPDKEGHRLVSPAPTPDGMRVAFRSTKANDDIHVYDVSSGTLPRVTYEEGNETSPVWVPPRFSRLAYSSDARGAYQVFLAEADGSGTPRPLFGGSNSRYPHSFSPDGAVLAFAEFSSATGWDIWTGRVEPGDRATPFLNSPSSELFPSFSPDGGWILYRSDDSTGRGHVWLAKYPEGRPKKQVSRDGGTEPRWSPKGDEIYFRNGYAMMVASVTPGPSMNVGSPVHLFDIRQDLAEAVPPQWSYAVRRDGRFLFIDRSRSSRPTSEICVVLNWVEELKLRMRKQRGG